jgi:hypothetical protein
MGPLLAVVIIALAAIFLVGVTTGGFEPIFDLLFTYFPYWVALAIALFILARIGNFGLGRNNNNNKGAAAGLMGALAGAGMSELGDRMGGGGPSSTPSTGTSTASTTSTGGGAGPEVVTATHSFPSGKSPGNDVNIALKLKEGDNPLSSAKIDYDNGTGSPVEKGLNPTTNPQTRTFTMGNGTQRYEIFVKDSAGESATETKTFNVSGPSSNLELQLEMFNSKRNEEIEQGMKSSEVIVRAKCENKASGGLDHLDISFGGSTPITLNLTSNPQMVEKTVEDISGRFTFTNIGDTYTLAAELYDGSSNTATETRDYSVTNKSGASASSSMAYDDPVSILKQDLQYLHQTQDALVKIEEVDKAEIAEMEKMKKLLATAEHALDDATVRVARYQPGDDISPVAEDLSDTEAVLTEFKKEIKKLKAKEESLADFESAVEQAEGEMENALHHEEEGLLAKLKEDADEKTMAQVKNRLNSGSGGKSVSNIVANRINESYP